MLRKKLFKSRGVKSERDGIFRPPALFRRKTEKMLIGSVGKRQRRVAKMVPVFLDSFPIEGSGGSNDIHALIFD